VKFCGKSKSHRTAKVDLCYVESIRLPIAQLSLPFADLILLYSSVYISRHSFNMLFEDFHPCVFIQHVRILSHEISHHKSIRSVYARRSKVSRATVSIECYRNEDELRLQQRGISTWHTPSRHAVGSLEIGFCIPRGNRALAHPRKDPRGEVM